MYLELENASWKQILLKRKVAKENIYISSYWKRKNAVNKLLKVLETLEQLTGEG
ncbi:hypothetical protein O9992_26365 [Vibrio lentus]|nr:hypothetical protein [Vibrio lentus]